MKSFIHPLFSPPNLQATQKDGSMHKDQSYILCLGAVLSQLQTPNSRHQAPHPKPKRPEQKTTPRTSNLDFSSPYFLVGQAPPGISGKGLPQNFSSGHWPYTQETKPPTPNPRPQTPKIRTLNPKHMNTRPQAPYLDLMSSYPLVAHTEHQNPSLKPPKPQGPEQKTTTPGPKPGFQFPLPPGGPGPTRDIW